MWSLASLKHLNAHPLLVAVWERIRISGLADVCHCRPAFELHRMCSKLAFSDFCVSVEM